MKPDWWILAEVARRMGWNEAFAWDSPAAIFAEHAALSGIAGEFGKDFDISALAGISAQGYDKLDPVFWPQSASKQGGRFFAAGGFFHPGGKAKMLPLIPRGPAEMPSESRPFRLNTGRLRDQWHTMTRTALSPRLSAHLPEPFVDMNPKDAKRLGLDPASLVRLSSPQGSTILRLNQTENVAPGDLFVPMHWTGMNASAARVGTLVAPVVGPISGQPESKAATVAAEKFEAAWYGFAISTKHFTPESDYWARARTNTGNRGELAGLTVPEDWESYARTLFGLPDAALQGMSDIQRGHYRIGLFDGDILLAALYAASEPVVLMRDFLVGLPEHSVQSVGADGESKRSSRA